MKRPIFATCPEALLSRVNIYILSSSEHFISYSSPNDVNILDRRKIAKENRLFLTCVAAPGAIAARFPDRFQTPSGEQAFVPQHNYRAAIIPKNMTRKGKHTDGQHGLRPKNLQAPVPLALFLRLLLFVFPRFPLLCLHSREILSVVKCSNQRNGVKR